jgi:hypothetical protein
VNAVPFAAAAIVALAMLAPHLVPLHRAAPPVGIAVWMLVLALRAVATAALATLALVSLAEVPLVESALAWCWHALLPDLPAALGLNEHPISHAAVALPATAVAASLVWLAAGVVRGLIRLRRLLRHALGSGPLGSTVVRDDRVVLAVTGVGRGRVIVSDRALGELDESELAAGLTHEFAHLRRRHRPLLVAAALLTAVGRPLPGTWAAERQLRFHLERDADEYTLRALHDPLALASAICKAAGVAPSGAIAALGGGGRVVLRLEELLDGDRGRSAAVERTGWAMVAVIVCVVVALVVSAPAWALGGHGDRHAYGAHACEHTG